ncbi:S9 family peptidase [Phocaeicola plebeius]|uniref:S9 family peptidase n=1 Tax=Phocaeicola plebeius TaxID=310297 RepID=A0A3E4WEH9_9BACT|nr:S9 family peptidase [Phocaeicola plebeius]HBV19417.1 S9 family peptidase [Bacteroides sp.]RGK53366.1 S9 family peptidase [Phocaeicola plebeius]RGM40610.1 S9 family peptidase [Phocaeicola plebeius]RGQ72029.1 S9 family peptidase [Phocaeicola plebeius]RGQ91075.1 S9 family peptidase [Phocaeicola plebeius]
MSCISLWAQGTVEDYNRAYALREKYNAKHVLYAGVVPHWVDQTSAFWYVRQTEKGKEYVKVDAASKKRTALFDQQKMASALTEKAGREINAYNLPLQNCRLNISLDTLRFQLDGKFWAYSIKNNRLLDEGAIPSRGKERHWMEVDDEKEGSPVTSPDGKWTAFIKNDNVYVREVATGKEKQLSQDGTLSNYYSSYIQWSPDSKSVVSCRIRPVEKRYVYYVESSPADQAQPKLHKQEYAKPGDELRFKVPCIFEVESGRRLIPSTELFSHQYELSGPMWNADSKAITFEYNERGHKVYRVLEMSAVDGSVRTLIEEKEEKYVNYPRIYRNYLSDGKRIIWSSERDNYNHLYLYDRATGKPLNQITKGEWYVRGVQHVDEANEVIYFSANGMKKGEDPYLIHYYKINFDGSNLVELTPEEGMHQCWYSSDYKYLVDVYSKVDQAPIAVLRDAKNGKIRMQLDKADISALLANGWKAPEVFSAKGRDGKTDMWGVIYRPSNFDPSKKYPVIEYIYSGPGDQYVPKTFSSYNWWMTSLAELGFIVVQVDGMTTSFRSKEFEEVCYKNLKDAGLPDHIAWIKAAAQKYPYMDIDRVGIFGCSAGGQESTGAVLFHPEFYKAAYSACGCHDNRMDKIWWNELWMGYPVDESYSACSNVDNAHLLSRPLMLVVGELDDNVDPASTMQVANALIKANKDFELVVIPGAHHTMGEDFGEHKRYDFFVRHLMGVTPPSWDKVKTGK